MLMLNDNVRNNKYFSFNEFIDSDTANKCKINNIPNFEVIIHIMEFLPLLNELRDKWSEYSKSKGSSDGALKITSGYRSINLNKKVGGSATSAHLTGYAVDLQPCNNKIDDFINFCRDFFKYRRDFDQVIIEKSGNTRWVHVGYKNNVGQQRCQVFNITK